MGVRMNDQELIYEFCGFTRYDKWSGGKGWKAPIGIEGLAGDLSGRNFPEPPPLDMNFYFKYAVPKLWICELQMLDGIFFVWEVGHPNFGNYKSGALENPVDAFGQALLKLIKGGG
jgi:hypothetical protein